MASQRHQHRAEHWIVLEGTAEVTRNGEKQLLGPHDAISIAAGDQHRLANAGATLLKVLEVASGTIDPEDIERQPLSRNKAPGMRQRKRG